MTASNTPAADVAAIILAGGQARRMGGRDKTLLPVGNTTILAAILATLDVPTIAISANGDPSRFAAFCLPVLPDGPFAGHGPLAGVLSGLQWADALGFTSLLTIPGDTPFLPRGLTDSLSPAPSAAASGGRRHPLIALWPVACRATLHRFLSIPGPRQVMRFAEQIGMRYVEFAIPSCDPFTNVNTPDDLALARSVAQHAVSAHATNPNPDGDRRADPARRPAKQ